MAMQLMQKLINLQCSAMLKCRLYSQALLHRLALQALLNLSLGHRLSKRRIVAEHRALDL
jgi:hypothetical protein